ncbi:MAG: FAD-dependent monooxygenase, partial [Halobacteriovoraceae bacterium]|nr:FAD-dependent monooxygenase [Halobacteriovoraceae bacterium]
MKLAIIGGGPIGLMTALYLERQGHTVDLFEKGSWPRDKTCGQGIMPSGIKMLNDLGIKFIEGEECRPFKGITYHDGSLTLKGLLPRKGYGIERKVLSQKLIKKIEEKSKIHLFPNTTVTETSNNFEAFKIKVNNEEKIYDYAFACDGMNSLLRKEHHNRQVRKGTWRMGAREHFEIPPWNDKVEVYWSEKVEAYVTPVSDNKVEVAFLWFEDALPKDEN